MLMDDSNSELSFMIVLIFGYLLIVSRNIRKIKINNRDQVKSSKILDDLKSHWRRLISAMGIISCIAGTLFVKVSD